MREGSLGKSIPVCSLVETVHWERGPTDSGATMEAVLTFPVDAVFLVWLSVSTWLSVTSSSLQVLFLWCSYLQGDRWAFQKPEKPAIKGLGRSWPSLGRKRGRGGEFGVDYQTTSTTRGGFPGRNAYVSSRERKNKDKCKRQREATWPN